MMKDVQRRSLSPRARQNVILELGYFIGRLGRDKVCALKKGDVEIPSDFMGVSLGKHGSKWSVEAKFSSWNLMLLVIILIGIG